MQNVERANIFGTDFKFGSTWEPAKHLRLSLDLNYSLQTARDISDSDSPTYNDQIAYIPVHTGNVDLSLKFKDIGLRLSNYTNSLRYALNENISNNEVDGFWVSTLSTYYSIKLKNKNNLTFRFTVKNLFNAQYAVIRSFVMPGRNYLIVLKYAFN
jgi:outer membrane receptor protein involved in Fe transport